MRTPGSPAAPPRALLSAVGSSSAADTLAPLCAQPRQGGRAEALVGCWGCLPCCPPTMPHWAIRIKSLELRGYLQVGANPPFSQRCYNNSVISTHRAPCSPRGEHVLYFISRDTLSPTCCPKHRMPHRTASIYSILVTDRKAPLLIRGTCDFV